MSGAALRDRVKTAAEAVVLGLCAFVPFRAPIGDLLGEWTKLIPDLAVIALFTLWLVSIRFRIRFRTEDIFFAAFILFGAISTVAVNGVGFYRFIYQCRSVGLYYLLYVVLRQLGLGREVGRKALRVLQWVSWVLCGFGLIERLCSKTVLFDPAFALSIYSFENIGRVYSLLYNPNTYGLFLVFVLTLSLYYRTEGVKTSLAVYIQLAVMLWLTMSRSSMIAAVAVVVFFGLILWKQVLRNWKRLLPRIAAIVLSVTAVSALLPMAAEAYYFSVAQKTLEGEYVRTLSPEVTEVSYTAADGTERIGYRFNGVTYADARCVVPLRAAGTVIHLPEGDVTLPVEQNKTREKWFFSNLIYRSFGVDISVRLSELTRPEIYQKSTGAGRIFSILTAFKIAKAHPFTGTGFGTYGSAASTDWVPPTYGQYGLWNGFYADCQYASVLGETGFVGLAIFLGFLLAVLWRVRRDVFSVLLCFITAWFGIFFNIMEVQICTLPLWSLLALRQNEPRGIGDMQAFNP